MQPRLTQKEIEGIEKELERRIEKVNRIRKALAIETDPGQKFKYEIQVKDETAEIDNLKAKLSGIFNLDASSGEALLRESIATLHLDEDMDEQDLINVNRVAEQEQFYTHFDQLLKGHFQYYLISGCATQMPHSFSEWAILDIAFEELEEQMKGILYRRKPNGNRVKIFPLPLARNLEKSQKAFKRFFAEFFQFKTHTTFDHYIQTGLPSLNYEYVAFAFDLEGQGWKPFVKDYIQWLIDTFKHPLDHMPTFLFFIVVYQKDLHFKSGKEYTLDPVVKDLDDLSFNNEATAHISPLRPVPVADLESWFRRLGARNPADVESVIELFAKGLNPHDQKLYSDKQQLNMDDIERLQKLVYDWYLGGAQ